MAKKESKEVFKVKLSEPPSPNETKEKGTVKDQSKKRQLVQETLRQSKTSKKSLKGIERMKKEYMESHAFCRVTFRLRKEAVGAAKKVAVIGDFNDWNGDATPMKKLMNGDFEITLELPAESEYRFRYLLDGCRWENDWSADRYVPNPYGCDDSVVIV